MAVEERVVYEFGPFRVDPDQRVLLREGEPVAITPKAFDTLLVLVKHSREVLTKDELMKMVWPDAFVEEGNLSQNIFMLRKALGGTAEERKYIITLPGRGYRFAVQVRTLVEDGGDLVIRRRSTSHIVLQQGELVGEDPQAPQSGLPILGEGAGPAALEPHAAGEVEKQPKPRRRLLPLLYAAAALAVAVLILIGARSRLAAPRVVRIIQITNSGKIEPWGRIRIEGSKMYFLERHGSAFPLMQVSTSGGVAVPASAPFPNTRVLAVAPDGSELLISTFIDFASDMPLWTMATATGALHRVGDVIVHDAAWYPDGSRIICSRGSEVFSVKKDGTDRQSLFHVDGYAEDFAWRPDGRVFRFNVKDAYENVAIWEASPGELPRELLPGWTQSPWYCCGAWTPDSRYYFFSSAQGEQQDVWALRQRWSPSWLGGTRPRRLTDGPHSFFFPAQSGNKRIFVIGLQYRLATFRYDAKQDGLVPFSSGASFDLAFSPDRQWVAYATPGGLWRSRIDGSERLQLTLPPLQALRPRWSPDGTRILFKASYPGRPGTPYIVDAKGGTPMPLAKDALWHSSFADWSPDGHYVAVDVFPEASAAPGIYLVNLRDKSISLLPGSEAFTYPRWSPDGRYIATRSVDEKKVFLYDTQLRRWRSILTGNLISRYEWNRNSQSLFFQDMLDPRETVFRFDVQTGVVRRVMDFNKALNNGAVRCAFEGFAPDGSLLVSIRSNNGDIYQLDLDLP